MARTVFLIAALGVENKLCRNSMKLGSRNKTQTELGASVSITITIDIGRPRAVVRQKRIEGVSKHPDTRPGTWSDVSFGGGNLSSLYHISSVKS
jgi:hypothetical protein